LSSSLHLLDLSFNNFDFASHRLLSSLFRRLKGLQTFIFDGNKLDISAMQSIVYSIRRHPSISSLSLSSCGINDELMTDLVFGLKSNPNVTDLNLSYNSITDEGLIQLLSALPHSTTGARIRRLDLSYCLIGDLGITALADACKAGKLRKLELLALRHLEGDLSPTALTQLLQSLRNHTRLQSLDLSGNCLFLDPASSSADRLLNDNSKNNNLQGKKAGKKGSKFLRLVDGSLNQMRSQLTPVAVQALQGLTDSIAGGVQGIFDQATQGSSSKSLSSRRLLLEYDDEYNIVTPKTKSKSSNSKSSSLSSSTKSGVKKKSKSNTSSDTSSKQAPEISKSKEELKIEAKIARQRARSVQSTWKALAAVVGSCPRLVHLGLARVGFTDAIVTQYLGSTAITTTNTTAMTDQQQKVNSSSSTEFSSSMSMRGSESSSDSGSKSAVILMSTSNKKKVKFVKSLASVSSSRRCDSDACFEDIAVGSLEVAIGLNKLTNSSLMQLLASAQSVHQ
jgi:hypothetical protein